MLLSTCAICDGKNSRFSKEQEANELFCLGIKTPFTKILLLDNILLIILLMS